MSKITAQPARGFPKASQAEKPSGEKNLQTWPPKGSVLSQRNWPQASSLCHQQEVNMQITFNQQPEATSLITKKLLPLRLILTSSAGGVVRWLWPPRDVEIVQQSICSGHCTLLPKWMEPKPQWTYQWYIYYGSSLNQYWINNPGGCCLPQRIPAPSHIGNGTLAWEFPNLSQRWLFLIHLWPPLDPVCDWSSACSFELTQVTSMSYGVITAGQNFALFPMK